MYGWLNTCTWTCTPATTHVHVESSHLKYTDKSHKAIDSNSSTQGDREGRREREGGRKEGRKDGLEGGREGGRKGGREGGREGGKKG